MLLIFYMNLVCNKHAIQQKVKQETDDDYFIFHDFTGNCHPSVLHFETPQAAYLLFLALL